MSGFPKVLLVVGFSFSAYFYRDLYGYIMFNTK